MIITVEHYREHSGLRETQTFMTKKNKTKLKKLQTRLNLNETRKNLNAKPKKTVTCLKN